MTPTLTAMRVSGIIAIFGTLLYAFSDTLLLAAKVDLDQYPNIQPYRKLLSGMERMVVISAKRLVWGGLLGVFTTPLILAGFWLVYQGLASAGAGLALPPALLFLSSAVVGAFVHGSFIYLGEYIQALNQISPESRPVIVEMVARHRRIMIVTYTFLLGCIFIASVWFSILVASGQTEFPTWMAGVNPVTALVLWMLAKRVLPKKIVDATEGAAFNIAYLIFFSVVTVTLWQ